MRHKIFQETPLTVSIALYIYSKTRKKGMVNKFSSPGLCVSFNRIDKIQSAITQNVCQLYLKETVCSDSLVGNLFTAAAIDNIDHNETSSTSSSHFPETSISII